MAQKQIIWSNLAKTQFATILEYYFYRNGNSNYSLKFINQLEDFLATLSKSDSIGRITSNKITRVISFKVYLIYYEVNGSRIEIISFWDNRQDPVGRKNKINEHTRFITDTIVLSLMVN